MAYFPQELIDNVVGLVDDNTTLAALAQASRRLYRTATPLLYRHVSVTAQSDAQSFCHRLKSLTTHLLQHPNLAATVETLELHHPPEYFDAEDVRETATLDDLFKSSLQHVRHPYLSQDLQMDDDILQPTQIEFYMTLLLLKLPNLRNFHAFPPKAPSKAYWHALGAHGPHSRILQPPFKSLDTIVLNGQHWNARAPESAQSHISTPRVDSMMSHIVPHIQAFSPRKLVVLDMGHCPPRDAGAVWGTRGHLEYARARGKKMTPKLDHFELRGTSLPLDRFLSFIVAPAALETFIYEHPLSSQFSMGSLLRLLVNQGLTMTHLCLDVQSPDQREDQIVVELLSKLIVLERLEIASTYLFGEEETAESVEDIISHLPSTISYLSILKTQNSTLSAEEMMERVSSRSAHILPNLRSLRVEGHHGQMITSKFA